MTAPLGVLLMAYGSPATLHGVEAYYTHIRGGRVPPRRGAATVRRRHGRPRGLHGAQSAGADPGVERSVPRAATSDLRAGGRGGRCAAVAVCVSERECNRRAVAGPGSAGRRAGDSPGRPYRVHRVPGRIRGRPPGGVVRYRCRGERSGRCLGPAIDPRPITERRFRFRLRGGRRHPHAPPRRGSGMSVLRRAPRPPVTQVRGYRVLVPGTLVVLALATALILVVAIGVLVGVVPTRGGRGDAALSAHGLSLASSLVTGLFAASVLRRYLQRGGTHLLLWGTGLVMFGIVGVTELISTFGWYPTVFRLWYLCGALLTAAWLGQGTVYLMSRRRRLAVGTMLVLLGASLAAAYLVFAEPLNASAFDPRTPLGVQFRAVLPEGSTVRKLTPVFNIYGTVTLVGGALYSAWLLWRKEIAPGRVVGNLLIAAGGLSLSLVSTLARFGAGALLSLAELIAAALMFAGFLLATARPVSAALARRVAP